MLQVIPISALRDNYIWLVINDQLGQAIVIDPGEASPVLSYLEKQNLSVVAILATHKHADHTAGIRQLLSVYPEAAVFAHPLENISLSTQGVQQDDRIVIDRWPITFKVIHIPGHTLGHIAFYARQILFSGDTLFGAGCGRLFEGTAEQMLCSLNKLMALPDDTLIYCGHEYTLANLSFALLVEPNNEKIQQRMKLIKELRLNNQPTLPSTLYCEKQTNPFLRCTEKKVIERVEMYAKQKLTSPAAVFRELREWKNKM